MSKNTKSPNDTTLPEVFRRFNDKIKEDPKTGCWVWTGAVQNRGSADDGGHRPCMFDPAAGTVVAAAVVAWRLLHGTEIPKGYRPVGLHVAKTPVYRAKRVKDGKRWRRVPGEYETVTVTSMCMRHMHLVCGRDGLSGENHPRAELDLETARQLQTVYVPRSKRMSFAKLQQKYAQYGLSREAIRQIVLGNSDGGQKVPKDVAKRMREEYQPPRQLNEFVPAGKHVAKSTLASAAAGHTWKHASDPVVDGEVNGDLKRSA